MEMFTRWLTSIVSNDIYAHSLSGIFDNVSILSMYADILSNITCNYILYKVEYHANTEYENPLKILRK